MSAVGAVGGTKDSSEIYELRPRWNFYIYSPAENVHQGLVTIHILYTTLLVGTWYLFFGGSIISYLPFHPVAGSKCC